MAGVVHGGVWIPGGAKDFDLEGIRIGSPWTLILSDMAEGNGPGCTSTPMSRPGWWSSPAAPGSRLVTG